MSNTNLKNFHASCVCFQNCGILITGKSGSGKSDLALRLIENKHTVLVSDDQVLLCIENGKLYAQAPETISGMMEVRGVGIVKMPFRQKAEIKMVVALCESAEETERLPEEKFFIFQNIKIPLLKLYPFEISAADKVVIKIKALLD